MRTVPGRPESSTIPSLPASRRSRWQSTGCWAPDLAERGRVLQGPDDPASTLHEGQLFPASGIEEPLVLCMVSIPPPARRHPAPDRKRSSGMARVFDCGSAESPPIWCRPQHRGAPRQDHPGADAPSEAEDQRITAVQASKGLTHRNIESDSLPVHPCLVHPRPTHATASVSCSCLAARARSQACVVRRGQAGEAHGASARQGASRFSDGDVPDASARSPDHVRRNAGEDGRAAVLFPLTSAAGAVARGGPRAHQTCANQLASSPSGSAVARTASIASISSFVWTPLRRMAAGPSPPGTTTDSTASAVLTP